MKDAHLTLRLPDALARELERAAEERGIAKSMVVREAVTQYLAWPAAKERPTLMPAEEFRKFWARRPRLTPEEAEEFEKDIRSGLEVLLPPDDPWA